MKESIVCVEWDDATFNSGYYDKKEPSLFNPIHTRTVGHLVRKTAKDIVVSMDRFYDAESHVDSDRHITTIPKKMIKRIIYLEESHAKSTRT